jgi:GWxTD domain-containing protein
MLAARMRSLPAPSALALVTFAALLGACNAPISTIRSPAHPRIIELRNTTDEMRMILIEPAAFQHLGGSTTFTGRLRPGETKILYLYDGYTYRFRLVDVSGARHDVRQEFRVASDMQMAYAGDSLVAETNPAVQVGEPVLVSSAAYEGATETQLDALVRRLDVFLAPAALSDYAALPVEGKRAFLVRFWADRDPTPGTPENEFRTEVEARLTYVENRFRSAAEGGAATPRGRIYLKYGKPDRMLARTMSTESSPPYEIWEYFTNGYSFVFLDELRSGRYRLLTSTDPNEPGLPDWRERLPAEAAEELRGPLGGASPGLDVPSGARELRPGPPDPTAQPSPLRIPLAQPTPSRVSGAELRAAV